MKTIDRYIGASFLAGCVPVLMLLLSLFSVLALSEELEDVGEGLYQLGDALWVVALGLPVLLVDLLPVTVLLGGLLGLGALANNLELASMRAAAISPLRMALPIVGLALALIGMVVLLQNLVIPQLEFSRTQLRSKILVEPSLIAAEEDSAQRRDTEFWTRSQGQFIRIGQVLPDRALADIEIYQFDTQGLLVTMVQAPRAQLLQDNTWLLKQVSETVLDNGHSETQLKDTLIWDGLLTQAQTRALVTPASSLAPLDLWQSIVRLELNAMNADRHRVLFWKQISTPLGLFGMALLALPFLLGSVRSVPVGQRIALGGVIGITYYLIQQISGHLAGILQWNIALTVLTPGIVVLCVALFLLRRVNQRL
jgi:lipopolysaccharide export system permease protein